MKDIDSSFDIVVIGGGATGCGVALDAASRGFKTLLLEKNDFASGTSSKSTKLLHGGVRYLESAIKNLDKAQYNLVKNSLQERYILLKNAPHLCHKTSLLTPVYKWYEIPYIFAGLTIYDSLSGKKSIGKSKFLNRQTTIDRFPFIKKESLKGSVQYYDGQFSDMRMSITIAKTAQYYGATMLNYAEVVSFIKQNGKISGVIFLDKEKNQKKEIICKTVINATGPFADSIRRLDIPQCDEIMQASSGIHIAIDKKYAPKSGGVLIPKTDDGRVLFMLPWEDSCIIGTTDEPAQINEHPKPKEKEIEYLINHINRYFDIKITKKEIKSAWSGLRPLVKDIYSKTGSTTASIVRDHYIEISESGLITIAGGKWTSFRKMAEDTVDAFVSHFNLNQKRECTTKKIKYYGSENFDISYKIKFKENSIFDNNIAEHLLRNYGTMAQKIEDIAKNENSGDRLTKQLPYTKAEVIYSIRNEFAKKPLDFLARRTSIVETDIDAAKNLIEPVTEIFSEQLNWDYAKTAKEKAEALHILNNAM